MKTLTRPATSSTTTNSPNIETTPDTLELHLVVDIVGPGSNSQPNTTYPPMTLSQDFPEGLWKRSFQKLSTKQQEQLEAYRAQEQLKSNAEAPEPSIKDLIDVTRTKQKEWEDRRWVLKFHGHTIVPRDYMDNIVNCLTVAGDIGVNFVPKPADVVWPVIKGAMQATATAEAEIGATLTVADLLVRYISCGNAYARNYLPKAKDELRERLELALENMCIVCLKLICVTVKQLQRPTALRVGRALWDPEEVQSQVSELEQSYSALLAVTQNCQSDLVDQIDERIHQFVNDFSNFETFVAKNFYMVLERLDDWRMTQTLDWISPIKAQDRHDLTNTDRLPDTCDWLLKNPIFREWDMSRQNATLWLQGSLGTGKTYLTSKVIEQLLKTTMPWEGFAYYYCKRTRGRGDEKPDDIIRSLFRQLAVPGQGSHISKDVQDLFLQYKDKTSSPDINTCKEQLLKLINQYGRTTIVLDALDECDKVTRKMLFNVISDLGTKSEKPMRVFFSARPDPDIRMHFRGHATIHIQATDVNNDIRLLIEEKVRVIQCWDDMSRHDQKQTVDKLCEKSAGMFQLVNLQIPYLMSCGLKQDVFAQLDKMPEDLTKAYKDIYDRLARNHFQKRIVDRAFMWVMCTYEPLTTTLILAAIRLDAGEEEPQERISKDTLLNLCSNLLVCDTNQDGDSWGFSHASVVEFIEERLWSFRDAHCYAAKVCLRFLIRAYEEPIGDLTTDNDNANAISSIEIQGQGIFRKEHDFHRYCQSRWINHVQYQELNQPNEGESFDGQLRCLLRQLMGSPTQGGTTFVKTLREILPSSLPILAMSRFSFFGILSDWWDSYEVLIEKGALVDQHGKKFSALSAAASCGHNETVQFLLNHGASVDPPTDRVYFGSALAGAASGGYTETVQLLLDRGASINPPVDQACFESALSEAALGGHTLMVHFLVMKGASLDQPLQAYFGSALALTAYMGDEHMAGLLLLLGASADLRVPGEYGSALAVAAYKGNEKMVDLLIRAGEGSVNLLIPGDYGSALAAAAYMGHEQVVRLLVDPNGSKDLPYEYKHERTLAAAIFGDEDHALSRIASKFELKTKKASVNLRLQSGLYGSSLAASAASGHAWVVRYLIFFNADVNLTLTTGKYGTALNAASYWGQTECVKILLRAGATLSLFSTPATFSDAFLAAEGAVGARPEPNKGSESECWGNRDEEKIINDKHEVTRILYESRAILLEEVDRFRKNPWRW
ncbi:Major facilitator superfamily domain general substrate transporter [Penicillium coprophilum]|uniref:Major facilitator superfamily domain general substrate transporter n=1 Tax=Penicillium coprophilum TaxID=36646 RepID=UPI0023A725AC|nr:Major facilitator superfamily domain general substrate transporter [Penicillium coprophilum]KAJ5154789.1 Major facilitator superfamily domain general substrate transporter [Penicillium coprophilum]